MASPVCRLCVLLVLVVVVASSSLLNQTLRAAGAQAALVMGSQFKLTNIQNASEPKYKAMHAKQYALSTAGNACKWQSTHRVGPADYDLTPCLQSFSYATEAEQAFRAHNLCWGEGNPSWLLNGGYNASQLRAILRDHIRTVMMGLKQQTSRSPLAYDVVNEACESKRNSDGTFFKSAPPWYPAVPNYVDVAFQTAREADPDTLLFYNDYGSEEWGTPKAQNVYAMVKDLVDRGVPIDGVGLQMHLSLDPYPNATLIGENIWRLGQLGLQVHVTEMDVKCPEPCSSVQLAVQARLYGEVLQACLYHKKVCTSFETWGFTDVESWLNGDRCEPAGLCHPLPFDEQYLAKPAAEKLLRVLQANRDQKL